MNGRPTLTDCDEAGDYIVPNVLSPRDLVFRPDNMDETVPHDDGQESLILHTKFHGNRRAGSGEEDFLRFLLYMGMAAIFVMWPASR